MKVHPPTSGAGILCIDGGGARGILPLKLMKRIQDRIGLPMRPQRFFKVIVGTSSGRWCKEALKAWLTFLRGFRRCWTIH